MTQAPALERILGCLTVDIEPFAVCGIAPGWRLLMGGAPWATFHFVLHGEGRLRVEDAFAEPIRPGCLCIVPPGFAHVLESGDPITREAAAESVAEQVGDRLQLVVGDVDGLMVACGRADASYGGGLRLFESLHAPVLLDFADTPQMQTIFERILDEERKQAVGSKAMTAALMNECLVLVLRRLQEDPDCPLPWLTSLRDRRMALLLDSIVEQPSAPHSVSSLADAMFMSRSAFSQRFKALFGVSPLAFVNEVRLRRASELLTTTDLTVDAIARGVGYASRSHFSRAFTARFGSAPAVFRAMRNERPPTAPEPRSRVAAPQPSRR